MHFKKSSQFALKLSFCTEPEICKFMHCRNVSVRSGPHFDDEQFQENANRRSVYIFLFLLQLKPKELVLTFEYSESWQTKLRIPKCRVGCTQQIANRAVGIIFFSTERKLHKIKQAKERKNCLSFSVVYVKTCQGNSSLKHQKQHYYVC